MLNIDTLKYNYYNDIAKFVINLCEGEKTSRINEFLFVTEIYINKKWMYSWYENNITDFSVVKILEPTKKYFFINTLNETNKLLNKINPLLKCLI